MNKRPLKSLWHETESTSSVSWVPCVWFCPVLTPTKLPSPDGLLGFYKQARPASILPVKTSHMRLHDLRGNQQSEGEESNAVVYWTHVFALPVTSYFCIVAICKNGSHNRSHKVRTYSLELMQDYFRDRNSSLKNAHRTQSSQYTRSLPMKRYKEAWTVDYISLFSSNKHHISTSRKQNISFSKQKSSFHDAFFTYYLGRHLGHF